MVSDIKCYVLNKSSMSEEQIQQMARDGRADVKWDENGDVSQVWTLWDEVENFVFSKPDSKHYTVDRDAGIVTFGDGVYGKIPDYFQDADNIRIRYSTNDGAKSNLDVGMICRFSKTKAFIRSLYNPLPTVAGYNKEGTKAAVKRSAEELAHLSRAVSACDYEQLAFEASLNIMKCKCFPNTNKKEEYERGYVTLVVLQKDYKFGGDYFKRLKKEIKDFIISKNALPLTIEKKFEIVEPRFICMNVKVYCKADSMDNIFYIQKQITDRINIFLDPVNGNFNSLGWNIGQIPNVTQIINYVKSVEHVKGIEKIIITYGTRLEKGFTEVDLEHIEQYRFVLPENGSHEVFVSIA